MDFNDRRYSPPEGEDWYPPSDPYDTSHVRTAGRTHKRLLEHMSAYHQSAIEFSNMDSPEAQAEMSDHAALSEMHDMEHRGDDTHPIRSRATL